MCKLKQLTNLKLCFLDTLTSRHTLFSSIPAYGSCSCFGVDAVITVNGKKGAARL